MTIKVYYYRFFVALIPLIPQKLYVYYWTQFFFYGHCFIKKNWTYNTVHKLLFVFYLINQRKFAYIMLTWCIKLCFYQNKMVFLISQKINSPQNGMPSGSHCPLSHTLLDGPSNSKPLSHVYVATDPCESVSSVNDTDECAGAPGNRHPSWPPCVSETERKRKCHKNRNILFH